MSNRKVARVFVFIFRELCPRIIDLRERFVETTTEKMAAINNFPVVSLAELCVEEFVQNYEVTARACHMNLREMPEPVVGRILLGILLRQKLTSSVAINFLKSDQEIVSLLFEKFNIDILSFKPLENSSMMITNILTYFLMLASYKK